VIVLTRQGLPILDRKSLASASGVSKGAYTLKDTGSDPQVVLMATGSEVALILDAADKLLEEGITARVVSMPCWELFEAQSQAYRDSVLPPKLRARVAVEAGASMGWHKWAGDGGSLITLDRFGASAPGGVVYKNLGFSVENVVSHARNVLSKGK
jgi:transketolase